MQAMKRRNPSAFAAALAAALACASSASAGLSTATITNPGFEDDYPTGSHFNTDATGWSEFGEFGINAGGWWQWELIPDQYPTVTGNGVGSLITSSDAGSGPDVLFQSLGTVDAGDVGKTFTLTADLGGKIRGVAGDNRAYGGDMTVSFRSGVTTGGNPGTILGSVGVRNVFFDTEILPDISGIELVTKSATFTPDAGDIGTEVFAVIDVITTFSGWSTQKQYIVDEVTLSSAAGPPPGAGLATTITNGGFEDTLPTGSHFNSIVPGWNEFSTWDDRGVGFWEWQLIAAQYPPVTGIGVGSLIAVTPGQTSRMFQSLGVVGTDDVDDVLTLTADLGGKIQLGVTHTGNLSVSFRSGVTTSGLPGVVLGSSGQRTVDWDGDATNGTGEVALETRTATFTPTTDDVGTEVFAVVELLLNADDGGGQNQFLADEVTLGIAPQAVPVFTSYPVVKPDVEAGQTYTGQSLVGDVEDPDTAPGGLTFAKVSGPDWLGVAGDGTLSGAPTGPDLGLNRWTVSVSDGATTNQGTLEITVLPNAIITTADGNGADGSAAENDGGDTGDGQNEAMAVRYNGTNRHQLSFVRFDLGNIIPGSVTNAEMHLFTWRTQTTQQHRVWGLNDGVADGHSTGDGLTTHQGENWLEDATFKWSTAPETFVDGSSVRNETFSNSTSLGDFTAPGSEGADVTALSGANLIDFLNADTNGVVTFIIERIDPSGGNYVVYTTKETTTLGSGATVETGTMAPYLILAAQVGVRGPTLAVSHDGTALDFSWNSQSGKVYDLLSATGLATDPATWPVYQTYQDIAASGTGTNTLDDVPLDGTVRFFAITERDAPPPPPLLDENFDDDNGGFTSVDKGSGSVWDWDDPDSTSPGGDVTTGNGGAGKCWGTDTGNPGQYTAGTDTCLRSPVFDLTGVTGAVLTFAHVRDIQPGDTAIVNIIDDTTDTVIQELFNEGDDDINTADWTNADPIDIPDTIDEPVRLEFRFTGAGPDEWMGWYIDDVLIEVP